jgi:hypothetical protein
VATSGRRSRLEEDVSRSADFRQPAIDSDHRQWRAVRAERPRIHTGHQQPFAATIEEMAGQSPRGVDYWRSASGGAERLYVSRGEYLYAVNVKDGTLYRDFGDHGRLNLQWDAPLAGRFNWTAGPIIAGDTVVIAGNTDGAGDAGVIKAYMHKGKQYVVVAIGGRDHPAEWMAFGLP